MTRRPRPSPPSALRRQRGALLVESLIGLALVAAMALAWLHVHRDAAALTGTARAQQAAAQSLRGVVDGGTAGAATVAAAAAAVRVEIGPPRPVGPATVESVVSADWTDADGRAGRRTVVVQRFDPPPAVWQALADAGSRGAPGRVGPGGRHPAWRPPAIVDDAGVDDEATPRAPAPEAPAATDAATRPRVVTVSPAGPGRIGAVRQLSGVLRLADPAFADELRRWIAVVAAGGSAGAESCRLRATAPDPRTVDADAVAFGPVAADWVCTHRPGSIAVPAGPGSTWQILAAMLGTRPPMLAVCRAVDPGETPVPPPSEGAVPATPSWALLDAGTPVRRVHFVLADRRSGCPAGTQPVSV